MFIIMFFTGLLLKWPEDRPEVAIVIGMKTMIDIIIDVEEAAVVVVVVIIMTSK